MPTPAHMGRDRRSITSFAPPRLFLYPFIKKLCHCHQTLHTARVNYSRGSEVYLSSDLWLVDPVCWVLYVQTVYNTICVVGGYNEFPANDEQRRVRSEQIWHCCWFSEIRDRGTSARRQSVGLEVAAMQPASIHTTTQETTQNGPTDRRAVTRETSSRRFIILKFKLLDR